MDLSLLCQVVQTLAIVVTCVLGLITWRSDIKTRNIRHIQSLPIQMLFDCEVDEILTMFDYNEKKWYGPSFHKAGEIERKVDKTLLFLDNICFRKYKFSLKDDDIYAFKYNICRCLENHDLQSYLFNLYHWCKASNHEFPYKYLLRYGEENGIVGSEFYDVSQRGKRFIDGYLNY